VGGSWELTAKIESSKYKRGGEVDKDGGKSSLVYEIGSDLNLLPAEVLGRGSTYEELTTQESALVGYWKFDEGSGTTANDSSGYGNNGTLYNGPTWTSGKVGGALSFDGVNDYVDCGNGASLNNISAITIEAWIYQKSISTLSTAYNQAIVNKLDWGNNMGYEFSLIATSNYPRIYSGNRSAFYPVANPLNVWVHYVVTIDANGNYVFYKNGVNVQAGSGLGLNISLTNSSLLIGKESTYFDGLIDEVRIYNRALSAAEIKALYDATK